MEKEQKIDYTLNNIIVQHLLEEQKKNEAFEKLNPLDKMISNTETLIIKYRKQIKRQNKVLKKCGLYDSRTIPVVSTMAELYELIKELEYQLTLLKEMEGLE